MVGAGYVGLVTAVGLARFKHAVELIEVQPDRLAALRAGRLPIFEPGLQELFERVRDRGRLRVSETVGPETDVILVCVGTPIGPDGESDLSQLRAALISLAPMLERGVLVVIRSTMPPGATERTARELSLPREHLLTNPEFLREGAAVQDFLRPSRVVIGRFRQTWPEHVNLLRELYARIEAPFVVVDVAAAELIKNGANAFLALKLSFVSELASLCEEYGTDVDAVLEGIGSDPRIGNRYMQPSFGFGGSCLPKELRVLELAGRVRGLEMHVATAASLANQAQQTRFAQRVARVVGNVNGRTIGLLGLAFKAGTDDIRDSPAIELARRLLEAGARVRAYDPQAAEHARMELPGLEIAESAIAALEGTHAGVIATEWPEFRSLDWVAVRQSMAQPVVIDGRRLLDGAAMLALGFRFVAVGTPDPNGLADTGSEEVAVGDGVAGVASAAFVRD